MPLPNMPLAALKKPDAPAAPQAATAMGQPQVSIEEILEAIAGYQKLGEALKRATTMQEVGMQLAQIAEYAEQAVVNEADNWFDKHTVSRNMKEIKTYTKDFSKLAEEADMINQRMSALYDDMGRILERYFEIPDVVDPSVGPEGEEIKDAPANSPIDTGNMKQLKEAPGNPGLAQAPDPKVYRATPAPPPNEAGTGSQKMDELTLRAIKAVFSRLKKTNPKMASKFAKLPPQKMQQVVWKLVK